MRQEETEENILRGRAGPYDLRNLIELLVLGARYAHEYNTEAFHEIAKIVLTTAPEVNATLLTDAAFEMARTNTPSRRA